LLLEDKFKITGMENNYVSNFTNDFQLLGLGGQAQNSQILSIKMIKQAFENCPASQIISE
jgi:hypothetical protein